MSAVTTEQVIAGIKDLPAMPAVVSEILGSLGRESLSAEDLARKLSCDQGLMAKVLRLANSPFFGVSRRVVSAQEAVAILGLRSIRSIVVASAVVGAIKQPADSVLDFHSFWRHSLATALCAELIAREVGQSQELAFVSGLLHDVGRMALALASPHSFALAQAYRDEHDCSLQDAESQALGLDHARLGACLAEHWKFPPEIVRAVAAHHSPDVDRGVSLAAVLSVSDNLVHALDLVGDPREIVSPMDSMAWFVLDLKDDQYMQIFERLPTQLNEICTSLLT
ncbi:MAG TPA: HDOD domain-containing protein [Aquabacterium sp.]|uniref:HDOD domain-containing protein n=1 Tax=Aquabacterium sp. TaxID=1872578 RepID=UPI002E34E55D|nr:HDOD domain-containing protein [Aquabacterium sp.]HEX5354848.1 HDOD domain-containing protein [Aquabacterium sp.]